MSEPTNPYVGWVASLDHWAAAGRALPLGGFPLPARPAPASAQGKALLFSPHPDDEGLTGALPLRLAREAGLQVLNIAVTLGSNAARRSERWSELQQACAYLGWPTECAVPGGLVRVTPATRDTEPAHWRTCVDAIRATLARHQPRFVVVPHAGDWNGTHVGTHLLVMDALRAMPPDFRCVLIETEFWAALRTPNLMVQSSIEQVADLVAALSFHAGEVRRNPYHLTLPAWMQDNVRRGGELVGGQGGAAPDYRFATLYSLGLWRDGARHEPPAGTTRFLPAGADILRIWTEETRTWK